MIGTYKTIIEKYKDNGTIQKISTTGQRLIVLMMLFVVANNIMVINTSAAPFNSSSGTAGGIGVGNGYFDNENTLFNITSDRNIFVITEPTEINLVEPVGFPLGVSNMYQLVTASSTTLRSALVTSTGYLVFVDSAGVKAKYTRNSAIPVDAGGSSSTSDVLLISATTDAYDLKEFEGQIYFLDGGALKFFSLDDAIVHPVFTGITANSAESGFGIMRNSSSDTIQVITAISSSAASPYKYYYYFSTASSQNNLFYQGTGTDGYNVGYNHDNSGIFITDNYIYIRHTGAHNMGATYANYTEDVIFYENLSIHTTTPTGNTSGTALNRADIIANVNIGSKTSVAMYSRFDTNQYDIFSFLESAEPTAAPEPTELTYTTATIESLQSQYYNRSNILAQYNVVLTTTLADKLSDPYANYQWMVVMEDPNSVSKDVTLSSACAYSSITDITCEARETMEFAWFGGGWLQGTWQFHLYEINTDTQHRALVASSSEFTVLNTTVENQSAIPKPEEPITSGTAPAAISMIDNFVLWLGMGINPVSKFLFALIWIAAFAALGLTKSNGNVAMALSFVPYIFFTYIEYIPKWVFVISIILMAIVSKAFR